MAEIVLRSHCVDIYVYGHSSRQNHINYDFISVKFIPNCLIDHDPVSDSAFLRGLFLHHSAVPGPEYDSMYYHEPDIIEYEESFSLCCSPSRLAERIYRTLEEPSSSDNNSDDSDSLHFDDDDKNLYSWLLLNYMCRSPVEITFRMLSACIKHYQPDCLKLLVGNRFSDPATGHEKRSYQHRTTITEESLQTLKDEAVKLAFFYDSACLDVLDHRLEEISVLKKKAAEEGKVDWVGVEATAILGLERPRASVQDWTEMLDDENEDDDPGEASDGFLEVADHHSSIWTTSDDASDSDGPAEEVDLTA